MKEIKVLLVAGARPNFMKIAPILHASGDYPGVHCKVVHTGQHYDYEMSQSFFEDLEMPEPDYFLEARSGSHAQQTAKIMTAFEEVCERERPDVALVVGDVNSTLACSITAKKMLIRVGHVEAGLRSFDLTMPEEINRMVTDAISDLFFVTEKSGESNLLREGRPRENIFFVGNVMIDNLLNQVDRLKQTGESRFRTRELKEELGRYYFLTLHRPSNVDDKKTLSAIISVLNEISEEAPIVFPVHPRTGKMLETHGVVLSENIHRLDPLGFSEALYLWKDCELVLTDSGGLQEETTALGIPCLTLRENTERPITVEIGTNILAGCGRDSIMDAYRKATSGEVRGEVPEKWDGKASRRIWDSLIKALEKE